MRWANKMRLYYRSEDASLSPAPLRARGLSMWERREDFGDQLRKKLKAREGT